MSIAHGVQLQVSFQLCKIHNNEAAAVKLLAFESSRVIVPSPRGAIPTNPNPNTRCPDGVVAFADTACVQLSCALADCKCSLLEPHAHPEAG